MTTEGLCMTPMVPEWKLQMMAKEVFGTCITDADEILEKARSMLEKHIHDIIDAFVETIVVHKDGFDWYLKGCGAMDREGEIENGAVLLREMTFTKEDAKEYLYAIDNRRRIHRWVDINVRIYT